MTEENKIVELKEDDLKKIAGGDFQDRVLACRKCGSNFIFTVAQQLFYAEKGFVNEPQLCDKCREEKKRHDPGVYYGVCSMCGKEVVFKFKPSRDRPIYCDKCKKIMLQEA